MFLTACMTLRRAAQGLIPPLVLLLVASGVPAQGLSCSAPSSPSSLSGAACQPAEAASLAPSGPSLLAGNPVDLFDGRKLERAIDHTLVLSDGTVLGFSRQLVGAPAAGEPGFGAGWAHGFETRLVAVRHQRRVRPMIVQADGRRIEFGPATRQSDGVMRHRARHHEDGVLEEAQPPRESAAWRWLWRDGRVLVFDVEGRLRTLNAPLGGRLQLNYDAQRLVGLHPDSGPALALDWEEVPMAGAATSPPVWRIAALNRDGRMLVRYRYDPRGRLSEVAHANAGTVRYQWWAGAAALLAGVELPDGRRSQYEYDRRGRCVFSRAAGQGVHEALRFSWRDPVGSDSGTAPETEAPREVEVYRGEQRVATFRFAVSADGEPRLIRSEGVGCRDCPRTGQRQLWSSQGLWMGYVGEQGDALTLERDEVGRIVAFSDRAAGPQAPVRRSRLIWQEHPVIDRLVEFSRDSVAPGRVARWQFRHDANGALESVVQSGFAPRPDGGFEPMARRLTGPEWRSLAGHVGLALPGGVVHPESGGLERHESMAGGQALLWRDDFGRVVGLRTPAQGLVSRRYDALDRLLEERRPLGESMTLERDPDGRVTAITQAGPQGLTRTVVRRQSGRIVGLDHPLERLRWAFDAQGRVQERAIELLEGDEAVVARLRTQWRHDPETGRLQAQSLPDGSWLHWVRDAEGQIVALERSARDGAPRQVLLSSLRRDARGLLGWVHGNGVLTRRSRDDSGRLVRVEHRMARHIVGRPQPGTHELVWREDGRLAQWNQDHPVRALRLAWDAAGRLIQWRDASSISTPVWRAAWTPEGGAVAPARSGELPEREHDAAGRLVRDAGRRFEWGPGSLLQRVRGDDGRSVHHDYGPLGERIATREGLEVRRTVWDESHRPMAELSADGRIERVYVWLDDLLVAFIDYDEGPHRPGQLRHVHADPFGAPASVTDERGRILARYVRDPFGRMTVHPVMSGRTAAPLRLRLPGQWEDPATGLHHNDRRWYDPARGDYLSPDPLGLGGDPLPYAYAGRDPVTRIDPQGLLLFAFDGSGNSDPAPRSDDHSNVYKLAQSYNDGRVWYMSGVGTTDTASGLSGGTLDAILALTARARVNYLLAQLEASLGARAAQASSVHIDILGFSRGAAMARDFANRVADRIAEGRWAARGWCVDLRFLGLWDTVAQFGLNGASDLAWKLKVPASVAWTAQAVALNEHRLLFPVESILEPFGTATSSGQRIERGFIGAHADIGGSYAEGDLSDVALDWMFAQAAQAGVALRALPSEQTRVSNPLLHDSNTDGQGDREFRKRNGGGLIVSREMQRIANVGGLRWSETNRFIDRFPAPRADAYGDPTLVGTVDMAEYGQWLQSNYGLALGW